MAPGEDGATVYNRGFPKSTRTPDMEAERLNSITNKMADLAQRAQELRRYL